MRILNIAEVADFAEKKNTMLYFCDADPKRKESTKWYCFSNVFENFIIHKTMLSPIFHKSASFRSRRFRKPCISTAFRRAQKNASIISWASTKSRLIKRIGFYKYDLKSSKSAVFGGTKGF